MRALLIDDERHARAELRELLREHPQIEIVGEAGHARQALQLIRSLKPDLLFLDIQMPEKSGFELLESLGGEAPRVIFSTAYDSHALRAFEFGAVDYLLKPIAPKRLAAAVRRVFSGSAVSAANSAPEFPCPPEPSARALRAGEKVLLSDGDRTWFVPVASIRGVESLGAHSVLWLEKGNPVIHRSLSTLEARLPSELFFRANRTQLINLNFIEKVEPWFSGGLKITLVGDRNVEISRRQARIFRQKTAL